MAMLIGTVSGIFILGVVGRAASAGIALFTGNSINPSLRGALEVVVIGACIGAIGGILLFVFRNVCRGNGLACGIIAGLALFIFSTLFVLVNGKFAFNMSFMQVFTLSVVAAVFMIYGIFTSKLIMRFNGNRRNQ
ncbi:hypothetical protein GF407_15810 [candidate division KSB1 bacterium]|nr:hypothetical protein [candidate division KSB1 bacterium]